MAPPTPVLTKEEITTKYKVEKLLSTAECQLKSLTQYECTFDKGLYTCNPFKRVFQDCITKGGRKQVVEVTDRTTNTLKDEEDGRTKKVTDIQSDLKRIYEETD